MLTLERKMQSSGTHSIILDKNVFIKRKTRVELSLIIFDFPSQIESSRKEAKWVV